MTLAARSHITIDSDGVARIENTRMKVIHLVKEMHARSASPSQLHEAFPNLSLAQIHAALAYYYDHQVQIDEQIRQESVDFNAAAAAAAPTSGRGKLRAQGDRP